MPLKLSVGLSRKVGLPDYGSLGASCHVELELEHGILEHDAERFQTQVRQAFAACRKSVCDEPASQPNGPQPGNGHKTNGQLGGPNGREATQRRATASQLRVLRTIASRLGFDLTGRIAAQFPGMLPEELSISDASRLIDELKAETNGSGVRG